MTKKKALDLSTVDGRLMDGLKFCARVYDLFDWIRSQPDGIRRFRLRPSKTEKRLLDELVPLAHYVQARYRQGRRINVRWHSGSQAYDAILWSRGALVQHDVGPRRVTVEITTSVHPNDYLRRELAEQGGPCWGVKRIHRDKKTRTIESQPTCFSGGELANDLAGQIIARIADKATKGYPSGTVLIVDCVTDTLTMQDEWDDAIDRIRDAGMHRGFREVFLYNGLMDYQTTLYGDRKKRNRRAA